MLFRRPRLEANGPIEVKPGYNAFGFGQIHLKVRVYRAAEDRWYDIEDKPWWRKAIDRLLRR